MRTDIIAQLSSRHPWAKHIHFFDSIDSTSDEAKRLALAGEPHGTVVIANHQTGGRGRLGRSFHSPSGSGIYMSVLLRPDCKITDAMHLTCAAAVAACAAIASVTGVVPKIKWTNDLVFGHRKLGGILTEPYIALTSGQIRYVIVGIGINCNQQIWEFPPDLQDMACSISMVTGKTIDRSLLIAHLIRAFETMSKTFLPKKAAIMEQYRRDCITIGQQIRVVYGDHTRYGRALSVDDDGGLTVEYDDGEIATVTFGEVSVRGMYGYA